MANDNRVLWSEGLFLQPHHFQQHDRWVERLARSQGGIGSCYPWGFRRLIIDRELLDLGKLSISECAGILPDGTSFDAPRSDPLPQPLDLADDDSGQLIYLALPLQRPDAAESGGPDAPETTLRYRAGEVSVRDNTVVAGTEAGMEVGRLDLRLMRQRDLRDGFACCGVTRVQECRADRQVTLDPGYVMPAIDFSVSTLLRGFVEELQGLLRRQGESRAGRVRGVGSGGVADWADFLLLQLINRAEPVVVHLGRVQGVHPEGLYRTLLGLAGELATFASDTKRPPEFPPYQHDDLQASFTPLIQRLREYLSRETVERAFSIPIQERKYGFRIALFQDPSLLADARFVLAGQAEVASQVLRNRFPTQIKIGPVEKIQELVKLALPGIVLRPLPTPPLEIPYHAGFDYFELDRTDALWKQVAAGSGLALHVGGEFPGLQLELWAIRE
ncbi:MAG: type VI secretion system baseplate subunit TssK [Chromatiaceae bacterium]|nr:type VI secretion system baseplate subunit TssK [Chromatiaceae bacterium]